MGMASHEPISVGGTQIKPIEVVNKVAMSQSAPKRIGKLRQYEIVRAVVKGRKNGKKLTLILDCHTQGMPEWDIGTDINTGSPPAIAALMLAGEEIEGTGVIPPEKIVTPKPFFQHLKKRKMKVTISRKTGWDLRV
jgi:saccharopine dehydrogenase-like NADP-dependent oxidoreductase